MWPTYHDGTIGPDSIGLTLVNRLEHSVRWTSASIDMQDGSGRHMVLIDVAPPGMGLLKGLRRTTVHSRWLQRSSCAIKAWTFLVRSPRGRQLRRGRRWC